VSHTTLREGELDLAIIVRVKALDNSGEVALDVVHDLEDRVVAGDKCLEMFIQVRIGHNKSRIEGTERERERKVKTDGSTSTKKKNFYGPRFLREKGQR